MGYYFILRIAVGFVNLIKNIKRVYEKRSELNTSSFSNHSNHFRHNVPTFYKLIDLKFGNKNIRRTKKSTWIKR